MGAEIILTTAAYADTFYAEGNTFEISLVDGNGQWSVEHTYGSPRVGSIHYMTSGVRFYTEEGCGAEYRVLRDKGLEVEDDLDDAEIGDVYKTYYRVNSLSSFNGQQGILEMLTDRAGLTRGEDHVFYADQIITVYKKTDGSGGKQIIAENITNEADFLKAANWSSSTKRNCGQMFRRRVVLERQGVQIWAGSFLIDDNGVKTPIMDGVSSSHLVNESVDCGEIYEFTPCYPEGYSDRNVYEIDLDASFAVVGGFTDAMDWAAADICPLIGVVPTCEGDLELYLSSDLSEKYVCIWVAIRMIVPQPIPDTPTPTPEPGGIPQPSATPSPKPTPSPRPTHTTVVVHCIDGYSGDEIGEEKRVGLPLGQDALLHIDPEITVGDRKYVPAGETPVNYPVKAINCRATIYIYTAYHITNDSYFFVNMGPLGTGPEFFGSETGEGPLYVVDTSDETIYWMHVYVPYVIARELRVLYVDEAHTDECCCIEEHIYRAPTGGKYCFFAPLTLIGPDGKRLTLLSGSELAIYGLHFCKGQLIPSCKRLAQCDLCMGSGQFQGGTCFQCGGTGYDQYGTILYVNPFDPDSYEHANYEKRKAEYVTKKVIHYTCCENCGGIGKDYDCPCPRCEGRGYQYDNGSYLTCPLCKGTKVYTSSECYYCKGNARCPTCSGTGRESIWEWPYKVVCSRCGGSGKYCPVCGGTGRYDSLTCKKCKGTGYYQRSSENVCSYCGGDGYFACTYCGGTGKRGSEPCTHCGGIHVSYVNAIGEAVTRITFGSGIISCECRNIAGDIGDDGYYDSSLGFRQNSYRCVSCGERYSNSINGTCSKTFNIDISYEDALHSSYPKAEIGVDRRKETVSVVLPEPDSIGTVAYLVYSDWTPTPIPSPIPTCTPIPSYKPKMNVRFDGQSQQKAVIRSVEEDEEEGYVRAGTGVVGELNAAGYLINCEFENITGSLTCEVRVELPYSLQSHDPDGNEYVVAEETESLLIPVTLPYSYWRLNEFEVYNLTAAVMSNVSETGESLTDSDVVVYGEPPPVCRISDGRITGTAGSEASGSQDRHVYLPSSLCLTLDRYEETGVGKRIPAVPVLDPGYAQREAYRALTELTGGVRVCNDILMIDGRIVISDTLCIGRTSDPVIGNLFAPVETLCSAPVDIPPDRSDGLYYPDLTLSILTYEGERGSITEVIHQNTITVYGSTPEYNGLFGLALVGIDESREWETVFNDGEFRITELPIGKGSNPIYREMGVLKAGYTWHFEVSSDDSALLDEDCFLSVTPSFTWSEAYGCEGTEVDLFYHEIMLNGYVPLIRVGSETDGELIHNAVEGCYSYGRIVSYRKWLEADETGAESVRFGFDYALPTSFRICDSRDDPVEYAMRLGRVSDRDGIWKKGGYLTVSFRISAHKSNEEGPCYEYEPGEVLIVYVDRTRSDDLAPGIIR